MANKIPSLGDLQIPTGVLDLHEWATDALIDGETGVLCTLTFPAKRQPCDNCEFDVQHNRSASIYKAGGPIPFTNHMTCPRCQGAGYLALPSTDTIRLRVYWEPSSWRNIGIKVADPEGACVVIGYMTDLPKLERADTITLHTTITNIRRYVCAREGEAQPWGFRKNRYFVQVLRRTGGG